MIDIQHIIGLLEPWMAPEVLLIAAAACSSFALVYALSLLLIKKSPIERRLEELCGEKQQGFFSLKSIVSGLNLNDRRAERKKIKKKKAGNDINLTNRIIRALSINWDEYRIVFEQAGFKEADAQQIFIYGRLGTMILMLSMGSLLTVFSPGLSAKPLSFKYGLIFMSLVLGWFLFDVIIKRMIQTRVLIFEKYLPDVLDLMMICVETGLSFSKSMDRVAKEMNIFNKDVSRELTITSVEMELLLDRRQALINMITRVPSPTIKIFATSMIQSFQQGTSIKQSLNVMSRELREIRMHKAENKAAKLPSFLVIPLMIFIFPNLFIILLGPSIVHLTRTM